MKEKFFEQFIDFLEYYIDEEIAHEEKYMVLLRKCTLLAENKLEKEHEYACEELDHYYHRLIIEKLVLYFGEFVKWIM